MRVNFSSKNGIWSKSVVTRLVLLSLVMVCLLFSGCECDEDTAYEQIKPNPKPIVDKAAIIEGPLPDMAKGGKVAFAPSRAISASEFNERFTLSAVDRNDPQLMREIAPAFFNGNSFSITIPITDSRISPLIVIREKTGGKNLLMATPGRVPAFNEVPESVRRIIIRGVSIDPLSTSRSLLAISNDVKPDFLITDIAPGEETQENVVRELPPDSRTAFDAIIENNVGGQAVVNEFSKAVQAVVTIIASPAVDNSVKNTIMPVLASDAASMLNAYVAALKSDDREVKSAFTKDNLPRSIKISETLIDAQASQSVVSGIIQSAVQESIDKTPPALNFVSLSPSSAGVNDVVFLTISSNKPLIQAPSVKILGRAASVRANSKNSFVAEQTILPRDKDKQQVIFTIDNIYDNHGNRGASVSHTTDGSKTEIIEKVSVAAPEFSAPGGEFASAFSVTISTATKGAVIKYTLDGSAPSAQNGITYSGAISIDSSIHLQAVAIYGQYISGVSSVIYTKSSGELPKTLAPVFDPPGSTYFSPQNITLASSTKDAVIRYTLDGSAPGRDHGVIYDGPFTISASVKVIAIAYKEGFEISEPAIAVYTIEQTAEAPEFSLVSGQYTGTQSVAISSKTQGAAIYYTLNGAEPSAESGIIYNETLEIASSVIIKAIAVKTGMANSSISAASYIITMPKPSPVADVEFNPAAGTYTSVQSVEITCATPGAVIYYTLDGSGPSLNSLKYEAPITIDKNAVIKAFAVKDGMSDSPVSEAVYTIKLPVAAPEFNPVSGSVSTSTQSVEITCATPGAVIYYTLDGSAPSLNSLRYEAPVTINKTTVIKAFAVKDGMSDSPVSAANYPVLWPVSAPAVSMGPGAYENTIEVAISCATPDARIYYTLDGGEPAPETAFLYTAPIEIIRPLTIKAIAVKEEMSQSPLLEAAYIVPTEMVAAPVITPNGGFFYYRANITINCATEGAEIYYTTDGSEPSKLSVKYEAPFAINKAGATTIKAAAFKTGMFNSMTAVSAAFTIAYPPPPPAVVTLTAGSHGTAGNAKVSGLTAGKKYVIKAAGGNWKCITQGGAVIDSDEPGANDAGLFKAINDSAKLNGVTEITGLTNGTTYSVYECPADMKTVWKPSAPKAPLRDLVVLNIIHTIKDNIDGGGLDLTGTIEDLNSNIAVSHIDGNKALGKIAKGPSGAAKISVLRFKNSVDAPRLAPQRFGGDNTFEQTLANLIGAGKLIKDDTITIMNGYRIMEIAKKSSSLASIELLSADGTNITDGLKVHGGASADAMLTITGDINKSKGESFEDIIPSSGYITFDSTIQHNLVVKDFCTSNVTVKGYYGDIETKAGTTAIINLKSNEPDEEGGVSIRGSIKHGGGTLNITADMKMHNNSNKIEICNGQTLTVAAGKKLTLESTSTVTVKNGATLVLSEDAAIDGKPPAPGEQGAIVKFEAGAKYQQGDETVRFCDVAADFKLITETTIAAAAAGAGEDDKLRAGNYKWDNSEGNKKFIRAVTGAPPAPRL